MKHNYPDDTDTNNMNSRQSYYKLITHIQEANGKIK